MPAIVSVKVISARDLPVMDRSSELTDAFVEIRLGQHTQRTEICKKTLNPVWDSPWFKFNVDDEEFQEEPLTFKIMDYDQYSAHDAIGRVYLLLASLTVPSLDGWFPIYDTLHGIRGEIYIKVTIEILKDQRNYKHSSNEVLLFSGQSIAEGYTIVAEHGFLEELVVNIDPEYQWIDKIRPPRASNESRQQAFMKLSGELQRKIRRKVLELGGNALLGFSQSFDLEGESGIVVRGIGTCVTMATQSYLPTSPYQLPQSDSLQLLEASKSVEDQGAVQIAVSPSVPIDVKSGLPITRVSSSESDGVPSSPLKGGGFDALLLGTSVGSGGMPQICLSEFPFYTLTSFPAGFIVNIAGIVSARSVKLLDDINNPDEPETRDAWWTEIRSEIRSHCRAMFCNAVIGYTETTSICDDLCILSGTGTGAVVNGLTSDHSKSYIGGDISKFGEDTIQDDATIIDGSRSSLCAPCHVPFSSTKCPFNIQLYPCSLCRSKQVSAILLSTTEPPYGISIRGEGSFIQARLCKTKRRGKGEDNASNISSILPFVEYGLHNRLLAKLKLKGMNSIFGLKISVIVGDTMVIGIATGTGLYLEPLPPPTNFLLLQTQEGSGVQGLTPEALSSLSKLQEENRIRYQLDKPSAIAVELFGHGSSTLSPPRPSSPEGGAEEIDLHLNTMLVEIEEAPLKEEDISEIISDHSLPQGFHMSTLSYVPSIHPFKTDIGDIKVLTLVSRQFIDGRQQSHDYQCSVVFSRLIQTLLFRVRNIHPCVVTNISFEIDLPEDDEIQVTLLAMVAKLKHSHSDMGTTKSQPVASTVTPPTVTSTTATPPTVTSTTVTPPTATPPTVVPPVILKRPNSATLGSNDESGPQALVGGRSRQKQISQSSNNETSLEVFVLSPQSKVKGYNIARHVGIINLFLIRETTSMRELGGMGSFLHTFISEAHNLALAQVIASGGHGLTDYQIRQCVVMEHSHKNQGQCLLNISGNAVQLSQQNIVEDTFLSESSELPSQSFLRVDEEEEEEGQTVQNNI